MSVSCGRRNGLRLELEMWMVVSIKKELIRWAGYGPLLREYVYFLLAKLAFHRQHPEFNGLF